MLSRQTPTVNGTCSNIAVATVKADEKSAGAVHPPRWMSQFVHTH